MSLGDGGEEEASFEEDDDDSTGSCDSQDSDFDD